MPQDEDDETRTRDDGDRSGDGRSRRNRAAAGVHHVQGLVLAPDGTPVVGATVEVVGRKLRGGDVPLAKTKTGKDGRYGADYKAALLDLIVRASLGQATVTSPVVIGAGADEMIDLVLGGSYLGPSDLSRIEHAIAPVLEGEGMADLNEDEIALLAAKSGIEPAELVLLRQSAVIAAETKLSAALFYALGRQRVPLSLAAIAGTDPLKRREAVSAAIAGNQVPPSLAEKLGSELASLESITIAEALRAPRIAGRSTLGALLAAGGVPVDKRSELVALHVKLGGDTAAFWKEVRGAGVLAATSVDRLQDTLRLGAITLGHVSLVEALHARKLTTPAHLATLEKADWLDLVKAAGLPPDLAAAGLTAEAYVDRIAEIIEDAVPTARIAARADHLPGSTALRRFVERNPAYELRSTAVATYLRERPEALNYLPDANARRTFQHQLEGVERVFRIAPAGARLATMEVLLADGIDSSRKIQSIGRAAFIHRYEKHLGKENARRVYARASQAVATATTLMVRHGAGFDGTSMHVLPARVESLVRFPSYRDLFGSMDVCACEHCQSLYSPAAYLVDVLHWLDGRPAINDGSALDVLFGARRADLGRVELSCANSHTPLPALDLVNEVLELSVAPPEVTPTYQTRGTTEDLRAEPEHQHAPAYSALADAVYPFGSPYSLWLDEARTYLGQLGVARPRLMEALHPGARQGGLADTSVAAESLGMAPLEWDVIAGKQQVPARPPAAYWGLADDPNWVSTLSMVSTLLAHATLGGDRDHAYAELEEWVRTDFVQAAGELGIWFEGGTCDTSRATLVGVSVPHLDRIHRFARLARRLGWQAVDLDRAIAILGGGTLDEALLVRLAVVRRLQTALDGIELAELLSWWAPVDTRRWRSRLRPGRPAGVPADAGGTGMVFTRALGPTQTEGYDQSFYEARFLSRSAGTAAEHVFGVASDGQNLLDETLLLSEYVPAIAAALGITATDLGALSAGLPDDRVSLANLSRLYRQVSLARALSLSVGSLGALVALTGIDPFDPVTPAATLQFIEEVRVASASRISVGELSYLLRHADAGTAPLAPTDPAVGVLLLGLRDSLRRAESERETPAARRQAMRSSVVDTLAARLGLDSAIAASLLELYVTDGTTSALEVFLDPALRIYDATSAETGAPVPPGRADLPAVFRIYIRLHKAALLVARLRITAEELNWVFSVGPSTGTLDVNALPVESAAPPAPYAGWARLRDAIALRDGLRGKRLFDLFESAATAPTSEGALLDDLVRRTGWVRPDIEVVVAGFGFAYPADWVDERAFVRVTDAMRVIRRVGLAAATVWPWRAIPAAFDAQQAHALEIRHAVRARYEGAQWRVIAAPLRDELRERQRDGLVGWLVAHDDRFQNAEDVSAHLLVDVGISSCQLTTRIRQAMSSVQLFVQRALMNLEQEVTLSNEDARAWSWMKTYRVWEANRKVFLYPENWIEPEFRDDKTPLYRALEDELAQREVTSEAAEGALVAYLERLDELARLEVVAVLHEKQSDTDLLHVFGRTRNTPSRYFYRQRVRGVRWTPWQSIDVDIDGDHLVPAVFNRRLYLFWAQITEASVEAVVDTPAAPGRTTAKSPERYYQLRLAWSEQRDGRWLGRKLSAVQVGETDADFRRNPLGLGKAPQSTKADFFFRAFDDSSGDLIIEPVRRVLDPRDHRDPPRRVVYVGLDRFRLSGCDGTMVLDGAPTSAPTVRVPPGTRIAGQTFASFAANAPLALPARNPSTGAYEDETAVGVMDGAFQIVPNGLIDFHSQDAFFVQDRRRTFLVTPSRRLWVRPPSPWLVSDAIAFEPARMYGELERPLVPRPDPWSVDASPRAPWAIRMTAPPAVIPVSGVPVVGLLAVGTGLLVDSFGARVAYVGGEAVVPRPESVAVLGRTEIVSSSGRSLLTVRSAGTPLGNDGLRALTVDMVHTVPPLVLDDAFGGTVLTSWKGVRYRFESFYHPYVCRLLRQVARSGVDGLLDPVTSGPEPLLRRQQLVEDFFTAYAPLAAAKPYPRDAIDFSYGGAYADYNWEIFFHVPFAIACWLSKNQRFAEAQRWLHYIFDPTESSTDLPAPQRFWKLRPFFELFYGEDDSAGPIHDLLLLLEYNGADPDKLATRDGLLAQIDAWRETPFAPHAVARLRLVAFQKAVVMKYLDNLIAWGDQLFGQNTLESINEATQLYVVAAQILGPRPAEISLEPPTPRTFDELRQLGLDAFGNAMVEEIEGYLPDLGEPSDEDIAPPVLGPSLYFCVPRNDRLLADYWGRVADRLFKIRHCMDIGGRLRQLPLFEPPIDPALLVRAEAEGIDLASALRDIEGPAPIHRYAVLAQKAGELVSEVRGFGQTLLATIEKKDAEELALLRADHEVKLLSSMRQVRDRHVAEAKETLDSLRRARESAEVRLRYYRSRQFTNASEKTHLALSVVGGALELLASGAYLGASVVSSAPDVESGVAGFGGSPFATVKHGGSHLASVLGLAGSNLQALARHSDRAGSIAAIVGGYQRRMEDWTLQGDVAEKDRSSLDRQILAAQIRVAIAERERDNLDLQSAQSKKVEEHLRSKYTNAQLYTWMVGQVSSLYFQSYQLAYEVAKRAERAWQRELARYDASFVQFGYWDSLKKGLLAGERLGHDLRRMEVAHLDQHHREYELTAHVSLRLLDPMALERLKTDGECFVQIPEVWYDLDGPGHYLRRIKNVAVSLPCVTGPYVPVRCTLTLLSSTVRTSADAAEAYPRTAAEDPRFRDDSFGLQSIVTSRAQEDAGQFETNLRDERYLPFEGAGAISGWRIELPRQFRQFDYETISDVVLHVRYTARDGGMALRVAAESAIGETLGEIALGISLRDELPDLWHRFLHPETDQSGQQLTIPVVKDRFPYLVQGTELTVRAIDIFLIVRDVPGYRSGEPVRLHITPPAAAAMPIELVSAADFGGQPHGSVDLGVGHGLGNWSVELRENDNVAASESVVIDVDGHRRLDASAVTDLVVVVRYRVVS